MLTFIITIEAAVILVFNTIANEIAFFIEENATDYHKRKLIQYNSIWSWINKPLYVLPVGGWAFNV